MAITTANAVMQATAPTASGQIIAFGPSDEQNIAYRGIATVTGDGASSTFDVNFIDGTATLPFTPSAVICTRTGGAATSSISVVGVASITNIKFTVNTSAAVNAATFIVAFIVLK